jgi:hypothetical protein
VGGFPTTGSKRGDSFGYHGSLRQRDGRDSESAQREQAVVEVAAGGFEPVVRSTVSTLAAPGNSTVNSRWRLLTSSSFRSPPGQGKPRRLLPFNGHGINEIFIRAITGQIKEQFDNPPLRIDHALRLEGNRRQRGRSKKRLLKPCGFREAVWLLPINQPAV